MLIKINGRYRLKDGGSIVVHSRCLTDTTDAMRCTTETGETVFYDEHGRILPLDGGKELARYNVEGIISEPK
jgi:hypothetical protein